MTELNNLKTKPQFQVKSIIIGLLPLVILGIAFSIITRTVGIDKVKDIIVQSGPLGPILFILFHIVTIMISPTGGGSVLILSSGALFGFWEGIFYSILSAAMGASLNFWIARQYGQQLITHLFSRDSVNKAFKRLNFLASKINSSNPLLLVPFLSSAAFNMLCYTIGLTKIEYRRFIIAVLISSSINVPIYVAIGASLIEPGNIGLRVFLILMGIAVVSVVIEEYWRKKYKARNS